jgi:hypothetical protein
VEHAAAFAAACGHPENTDDLEELLSEELDPDSVFESERLAGVLRLLGLPRWLGGSAIAAARRADRAARSEVTRLGAGVPGAARVAVRPDRERRPAAAVPHRGASPTPHAGPPAWTPGSCNLSVFDPLTGEVLWNPG